jgi:hypothetical protein
MPLCMLLNEGFPASFWSFISRTLDFPEQNLGITKYFSYLRHAGSAHNPPAKRKFPSDKAVHRLVGVANQEEMIVRCGLFCCAIEKGSILIIFRMNR